jgi:hypothetical protein
MSDEPREEPEQPNEDEAEEPNEKEPERYVPSLPPDIRRSLAQFNRDWPKLFSVLSPNWQKQFAAISQENTARIVREMQKSIVPRLDDPGFLRSLRLADDVQAQWAKSLAGSSSPLPQISEAVKAWQRNYVDNISAMVAKAIAPVDFGSGLGATLKRFAERVREWEEAQRELLALIAPRGWLLSPSLAMEAPVRMLEIAKEEGVDALEEELIRLYDADRLEEIIEGFYDRPSFEQWRPLCDEAIDAHRRGSYRLAILAWLPAIEGIIREEFGPRDVFTIVRRKKGRTVKIAIAPDGTAVDALLDALIKVLVAVGSDPNQASKSPVLQRHAIEHGHRPDIGGEKDSIQCVLMLEVIHLFVQLADQRREQDA